VELAGTVVRPLFCAKGITIGDGKRPIKPEEIQDNWSVIKGLDEAKPLGSVAESFEYMNAASQMRKFFGGGFATAV